MFRQLIDFSNYTELGVVSTVFFFLLFSGLVVGVLLMKKSYIDHMEELPLDGNDGSLTPEEDNHG